jgi:hypothetical protein
MTDYVDRRQWKYDPMTGEPLVDGWPLYSGLPQPELEPVLWAAKESMFMWRTSDKHGHPYYIVCRGQKVQSHQIPLYTAPPQEPQIKQRTGDCLLTGVCAAEGHRIPKPQREWQGLTEKEKEDVLKGSKNAYDAIERIEAKLKEKNSG